MVPVAQYHGLQLSTAQAVTRTAGTKCARPGVGARPCTAHRLQAPVGQLQGGLGPPLCQAEQVRLDPPLHAVGVVCSLGF